ncbi:MAG: hypothetical protein IJL26_03470 [Clostridia bacterium]|nr:hypothetical protein [Clostridia bacterium]
MSDSLGKTAAKRMPLLLETLIGALLMGFLWRVRGTHGWGSSWGLLNAGFVFLLFLTAAVRRKRSPSLLLISLAALSFMLTSPAWGTLLGQITGVLRLTLPDGSSEDILISPASGVVMMLCMGFGLAGVFGVLLGRCFSDKKWRVWDYVAVAAAALIVTYAAKATIAHLFVRVAEPQAAEAFADGLKEAGIDGSVFKAYLAHFNSDPWAKKIAGGRNYYACVSAFSAALAAVAAIMTARFIVKDKYAAGTGALVCGAFAFSITVSDLFFFFGDGGYRMAQGFSLPESFAPWSLWEYFTGFFAGGIITFYIIKTSRPEPETPSLLDGMPRKAGNALFFFLTCIGGIGLNAVRPVLVRLDESKLMIPATVAAALIVLAVCLVLCKKYGARWEKIPLPTLSRALCAAFVVYIFILYMFVGEGNITSIGMLHNILVCISAAAVLARCACKY